MLIFITWKSEASFSKRKNKRKINIDYNDTHHDLFMAKKLGYAKVKK